MRQVDEEDNPKPDGRLLVSGIGLGQLTTSFRGLASEDRGSETIEFGVADSHDGVTRHKTEQGAFLTNMWPNLGGDDIWRPGATADDIYGLHRKSTLSGVCSSCDNDYEIDLGLNSLGETTVGGAMALPEGTGVAKPPRITFTEDDFYPFLSCYICSGEFISVDTFEAHMKNRHPLKYNCRFCQMGFSGNTRLTDHINTDHVTWSTSTYEDRDDELDRR